MEEKHEVVHPENHKEGMTYVVPGAFGGLHTYSEAEKKSYCDFINDELRNDKDLENVLPMDTKSHDLFDVISKGVLLWYVTFLIQNRTNELNGQ